MCNFLVRASGVLVAVVGLAGCYDLSDPTGPRQEDFARSQSSTEQQQQGQQGQAQVAPSHEGRADISLDADVAALLAQPQPQPANLAARKLRVSVDDHE